MRLAVVFIALFTMGTKSWAAVDAVCSAKIKSGLNTTNVTIVAVSDSPAGEKRLEIVGTGTFKVPEAITVERSYIVSEFNLRTPLGLLYKGNDVVLTIPKVGASKDPAPSIVYKGLKSPTGVEELTCDTYLTY